MVDVKYNYAILWDMDGVLVNTGEYHYKAWKKTFQELGVSFSEDQFRETFGMNNTGILEIIFGQNLVLDEVQKSFEFFSTTSNSQVDRVLLTGGGSLISGVDGLFSHHLETPVEILNPMKGIKVNKRKSGLDYQYLNC